MIWTKEPPGHEGWYWQRENDTTDPTIIKVEIIGGEAVGWWFDLHPIDMDGEWCGPIPPPPE